MACGKEDQHTMAGDIEDRVIKMSSKIDRLKELMKQEQLIYVKMLQSAAVHHMRRMFMDSLKDEQIRELREQLKQQLKQLELQLECLKNEQVEEPLKQLEMQLDQLQVQQLQFQKLRLLRVQHLWSELFVGYLPVEHITPLGALCCLLLSCLVNAPLKSWVVLSKLIQSVGPHIWFPGFLHIVVTWFVWKHFLNKESKVVWKYKLWQLLKIIFVSNNLALKFADFVRTIIPHLAPCNALHNGVSCNTKTSKYVARTHDHREQVHLDLERLIPIVGSDQYSKIKNETFSIHIFQIRAGFVYVTKLTEDQFSFMCAVRGRILEDFVAITDWERMAAILCILEFWTSSPKVGVIENLIYQKEGIYCHALNIREIVEGVYKSIDYFSIFKLREKKQFFVGCGGEGISTSKDLALQGNVQHSVTPTIMGITLAIGVYYQLQKDYKKVATASLVILVCLTIFIFFLELFGHLFKQSCFYWFCTMLCCRSKNCRLGIYLSLKKRNSSLAYCDDFRPDLLQLVDTEKEVILLRNSNFVTRNVLATRQIPDWAAFHIMDINKLGNKVVWHSPQIGNDDVKFQLYEDLNNRDAVVFKMEYPYSNCLVQSKRTILARSTYDRSGNGERKSTMTTEVSLDGDGRIYNWPVHSFHLFIYLMLKWRMMKCGVIKYHKDFMFKTYYHVFSTHGLAARIEDNEFNDYFLLLSERQPSIP